MQNSARSSQPSINVIRICAHGPRFDLNAIRTLLAQSQDAISVGARCIVLDLSALASIDSVGINALVTVRRRAGTQSKVVLAGLAPAVQTVARVCHLHEIFEIYASFSAAEQAHAQ